MDPYEDTLSVNAPCMSTFDETLNCLRMKQNYNCDSLDEMPSTRKFLQRWIV